METPQGEETRAAQGNLNKEFSSTAFMRKQFRSTAFMRKQVINRELKVKASA